MPRDLVVPQKTAYDVVIVGGAMYGSSVAWWLSRNPDFDGSILLVERDPSYEFSSTAHTNSCIRQQFSTEINIEISRFGAQFIKRFREFMEDDEAPDIVLQNYGYMYLANNAGFAETLSKMQKIQISLGAGTRHMSADEIKAEYPFYNMSDIIAGNHNLIDEGYFDGGTIFEWWQKKARENGAEYCFNEVVGIDLDAGGRSVTAVRLASGQTVRCGHVVNCSGPRAVETARMVGVEVPVEPRKRYTFIFDAQYPLNQDLPLTIDPTGVHMRTDGRYYLAGCPPTISGADDPPVAYDDFNSDHSLWEAHVWPVLAHRIPQFEAIRLVNSWVGHYAFNTFDHNAIIGPHTDIKNFVFANGFSGHGLQQSPAMGRGIAEQIIYGEYRSLDLTPFAFERIGKNITLREMAII